jgi:hydrogenase-4 component B
MNELLVLVAIALAASSGAIALVPGPRGVAGDRAFVAWLGAGSLLGMVAAARALGGVPATPLELPWSVPGGALAVSLDALSAVFVLQVCLIGGLGAIYGLEYWPASERPDSAARLRGAYGLVVAGMLALLVARNAVLFLVGWEVMAIAAFFAITSDDTDDAVRASGYVYLAATRVGTLCLIAAFATLRAVTGSFSLDVHGLDGGTAAGTAILVLAVVGFGMKAGLMPLHVWLPGAHANAPSHVSALMSGVLLKMGIYGLYRLTGCYGSVPLSWGLGMLVLGSLSAVLGVAFALGQHDFKRLLAYHSVENVGIIALGFGMALVGRSLGRPELVALGFAGSLLHVFNHGLFKSLLFFAAGATLHAVHTRELDRLGGLLRALPWTALAFLIGAVAIAGLPPLNGFISELLLYVAALRAETLSLGAPGLAVALGAPTLALVGGLAVACFVKVFGVVYSGLPRTPLPAGARDPHWPMLLPMATLVALCAAIGLVPFAVVPALERATRAWTSEASPLAGLAPLGTVSWLNGVLLLGLLGLGYALFRALGPSVPRQPTWDCGYAEPTPRMQYTASSFAEGLVELFSPALRPTRHGPELSGIFPAPARFASHVPEVVLERCLVPFVGWLARGAVWLRWIQHGNVHLYLVYVLATLVLMLVLWR